METVFSADQDRDPVSGLFKAGNNARALKRTRIESVLAELAAEFGGVGSLSATEKILLRQAATLTVSRPRDQVRHTNAIARAIAAVRRGRGVRPPLRLPVRS
jgi:hypothetical protein